MALKKLYNEFFNSEKAGGLILVAVTILSIVLANSPVSSSYLEFWNIEIGHLSLVHIINDGLMAIFFLLIGLELEREIYEGELSSLKNASLPLFAAVGGMVVPAGVYLMFNWSGIRAGAGIPMATDIAFALGILSLLGKRVPATLKIFLTALAVIDDLGAIIIIAIVYTSSLSLLFLFLSLAVFALLLLFNRMKIYILLPYLAGGALMWYFMYKSGIHATITGVLLAFTIPFGNGGENSPSWRLQHYLHKPVAFIVLPLFAIANTGIILGTNLLNGLLDNYSIGIIAGLCLGKPAGILLFSFAGVTAGLCTLPADIKWSTIAATGFLAGIGFTMSFFISIIAFGDSPLLGSVKFAVLIGSLVSGITGYMWLNHNLRQMHEDREE